MKRLPVDDYKKEIGTLLKKFPVVIITAETGAGKSTRIPLWFFNQGKKVIVTQPRRIAAKSLAFYSAKLRKQKIGEEIGYITGLERKVSKKSRLIYLTDGVEMLSLLADKDNFDLLILDEIHEWNINQEVIIGLIKMKLDSGYFKQSNKRIVVMSATLEGEKLSKYFNNAPVINIPGRGYEVRREFNRAVFRIADTINAAMQGCNILVFLPGKEEINSFIEIIKKELKIEKISAIVLPLHSELSLEEQSKIFKHYPNKVKIIVSTDIAQTSLTIDDIDMVIDSGVKKEIYNNRGIEGLYPVEISVSECEQRAGRAGRVKEGIYILSSDIDMRMREEYPKPEIMRLNSENVVLRFIRWGIDPLSFPFFHSPSTLNIRKAIAKLIIFGALNKEKKIIKDGKIMADLPVSVRSARMIIEAVKYNKTVLEKVLKLIAIIELKGIVSKDFNGVKAYDSEYNSDLLNQLYIWENFRSNRSLINLKKFYQAKDIFKELKRRVISLNYLLVNNKEINDINTILYSILLSGFCDNFYKKEEDYYIKYDDTRLMDRNSMLKEFNPKIITGLPFDIVIKEQDQISGEYRELKLPVITLCSEFKLREVEKLQPYSYHKKEYVDINPNEVYLIKEHYFSKELILKEELSPSNCNKKERKRISFKLSDYLVNESSKDFLIKQKLFSFKELYQEACKILNKNHHDFMSKVKKIMAKILFKKLHSPYWNFLVNGAGVGDDFSLALFFNKEEQEKLFVKKWPVCVKFKENNFPLLYYKSANYIRINFKHLVGLDVNDLKIPLNRKLGFIVGHRLFKDRKELITAYDYWIKEKCFKDKWADKEVLIGDRDLGGLNFPMQFEAGKLKGGETFYFYAVPKVNENFSQAVLIHFFDYEQAHNYFKDNSLKWKEYINKMRIKELKEGLFKS